MSELKEAARAAEVLRDYQSQCDEDGTECQVSREAVDVVVQFVLALDAETTPITYTHAENARLDAAERRATMLDGMLTVARASAEKAEDERDAAIASRRAAELERDRHAGIARMEMTSHAAQTRNTLAFQAEAERLREAIEKAPHTVHCAGWLFPSNQKMNVCDCWKRRALNPEESDE